MKDIFISILIILFVISLFVGTIFSVVRLLTVQDELAEAIGMVVEQRNQYYDYRIKEYEAMKKVEKK